MHRARWPRGVLRPVWLDEHDLPRRSALHDRRYVGGVQGRPPRSTARRGATARAPPATPASAQRSRADGPAPTARTARAAPATPRGSASGESSPSTRTPRPCARSSSLAREGRRRGPTRPRRAGPRRSVRRWTVVIERPKEQGARRIVSIVFAGVQDAVYVALGLLLAATAAVMLVQAAVDLARTTTIG